MQPFAVLLIQYIFGKFKSPATHIVHLGLSSSVQSIQNIILPDSYNVG